MRIIRLKINSEVEKYLKNASVKLALEDSDLVLDLFALFRLKGMGLPDTVRTETMIKALAVKAGESNLLISIYVKKRLQVLKYIVVSSLFQSFLRDDPIDATIRILYFYKSLHAKQRQAQCLSCQYFNNCSFGKQYAEEVTDITKIIDPDYEKKVHSDCPHLPSIGQLNQLNEAIVTFNNMIDEENQGETNLIAQKNESDASPYNIPDKTEAQDFMKDQTELGSAADLSFKQGNLLGDLDTSIEESTLDPEKAIEDFTPSTLGGCSKNGRSSTFTGGSYAKYSTVLVDKLSLLDFQIYELGRNLDTLLETHKKGKFKPSEQVSPDKDISFIEKSSDITKLVSSEHALPDEVFDAKLGKKELTKKQPMSPFKKKPLMYLLIDSSASMGSQLQSKRQWKDSSSSHSALLMSRAQLSQIFSLAIAKRVKAEGGIIYSRYFDTIVRSLNRCESKEEFQTFSLGVAQCDFSGGGTYIERAISVALKDIQERKDDIVKSEILLITDCQDNINENRIRQLLKNTYKESVLNILDVSGNSDDAYGASKSLKKLANNYHYVDPSETVNLKDMIKLL